MTATKQRSTTPTSAEIVAGIPDLKPGQTWFVGDVQDGEYRVTAQGFSRRRYVTQRCRAAVRPRGAGRPAASRTASRSTAAASGDPDLPSDQPPAALAAPKLPQAATAADDHPPAAFTSFPAGADAPRPDRSIPSVRASAGVLFHSDGNSFALDTCEIEGGFVRIEGRVRHVTGAEGSETVRFGPDVTRTFPARSILKIVEGNR